VITSAPGKLILFGEHAVVLGKTAIATAVDLRIYVQIESNNDTAVKVSLPHAQYFWKLSDLQINELDSPIDNPEITPALTDLIERLCTAEQHGIFKQAMMSVLFLYIVTSRGRKQGVTITIKSQVPFGVGLGSSAAFNTSLAAGLLKFFSYDIGDDVKGVSESGGKIINKYAFQGERIMHGNPSGIDNTTSTFGGIIAYTAGQIEHLSDVPDIKLIITNTKITRNTKQLVQKVGTLHRMFPNITGPLLDSVHNISQNVLKIFKEFPMKKSDEMQLEI